MDGINGVSSSVNLQQVQNINIDLPGEDEIKQAVQKQTADEVQKADPAKAKEEAESTVQNKDGLGLESAKKFAEVNTVEVPKEDGTTPFQKAHPKLALAAQITEMIIDALLAALSQIAEKLPDGIGKYITGGLGVLKGVCGLHKCKDLESASKALSEQIEKSAKDIAEGIWGAEDAEEEENDGKVKVGKLVAGGGKAIFGLVKTFTSDDPAAAMKSAVEGAASFCEGLNGRFGLTPEVCKQIGDSADKVSAAAPGVVKGIKDTVHTLSTKTSKAVDSGLEDFEKAVQENKDIPAESKAFVKKLVAGTREAVKKNGYKKALEAYTGTIGSLLADGLNAKEKKVFNETISLIGDIAAEKDPVKAYKLVLAKAKSLAGGESEKIDTVAAAVEDAVKEGAEIVEKADATANERSVQADVGSFQERLKNLEGLMKKGQS